MRSRPKTGLLRAPKDGLLRPPKDGLLRPRNGEEAKVTYVELFFDLIYAFAVTQLSHKLVHDLSLLGALETLVLWFAVWLGWQYTCWVTNWFDPERIEVRLLLLAIMLIGMVMAASLPYAYAGRGLIFALSYVGIQLGRSLIVLLLLGRHHALSANFRRICGWLTISGLGWIAGGLSHGTLRFALWTAAVLCEYISPMIGFALPVLGRSRSTDWRSAEGGHIAERCQGFVILALGESVLVTGATLSDSANWSAPTVISFLVCFTGSCALWWIYFDRGSRAGSRAITESSEPGMMAAYFHYVHAVLIAGIVACAAADDLVIEHPDHAIGLTSALLLLGGPFIYLLGNALYKRVIYGRIPLSHWIGAALLALIVPFAFRTDLLMVCGLTTLTLMTVAAWESISRRRSGAGRH